MELSFLYLIEEPCQFVSIYIYFFPTHIKFWVFDRCRSSRTLKITNQKQWSKKLKTVK